MSRTAATVLLRAAPTRLRPASIPLRRYSTPSARPVPAQVGSIPAYTRHLVLRIENPYSTWPSHLQSVSPLIHELGIRWGKHPELRKLGLGFAEASEGGSSLGGAAVAVWDKNTEKDAVPVPSAVEEVYEGTLYPDFLPVKLSASTLQTFEELYLNLPPPAAPPLSVAVPSRCHIFVCTHGTRDCRCSAIGEPLYQSLLKEVRKRNLGEGQVKISRTAHVGGHKWAGNALVYTEGGSCDWYGLLRDTDAPSLLNTALASNTKPLWPYWRGRLGLDPAQTVEMFVKQEAPSISVQANKQKSRVALGTEVKLTFKTWDEEELTVTGYEGETIMETARRHDIESILATCGGFCECATCHIHLPPIQSTVSASPTDPKERSPISIPWTPVLPPVTDEEDEQLEFALGRDDHSRLGCQIPVTVELGEWIKKGGRVILPRY